MRTFCLLIAVMTIATASRAWAFGDLRVGVFQGKWCNYPATFVIQKQEPGKWVFHGRVLIKSTKQYDPLWIEQYGNNSLRMIRYLAGDHAGQVQVVQTYGPEVYQYRGTGRLYYQFKVKAGYAGCEGTDSIMYVDAQ